jgi:thiol-disulfide isomerase/thioredoxin
MQAKKSGTDNHINTLVRSIKEHTKGNAVVLVYAEWCPHCVSMKPAWNQVKAELKNNTKFIEIESEHMTKLVQDRPEVAKTLLGDNQVMYPTIIVFHKNTGKKYNDARDVDSMTKAFKPKKTSSSGTKKTKAAKTNNAQTPKPKSNAIKPKASSTSTVRSNSSSSSKKTA